MTDDTFRCGRPRPVVRADSDIRSQARELRFVALANLAQFFRTDFRSELSEWSEEDLTRLQAELENLR